MLSERSGGYDDGYQAVPCFWGTSPGSLVRTYLDTHDSQGQKVLDVGAGEGKNAVAFQRAGATVDALEISVAAIANGRSIFKDAPLNWINANAETYEFRTNYYDVVVCYGLVHCLSSEEIAQALISRTKASLKIGGTYILVSFNDGSHDFRAHPNFSPLLLSHNWYLRSFSNWEVRFSNDSLLYESHPHNGLPHHHSLTRLVAICR